MLMLNNEDVARVLDIPACIEAIEEAYKELAVQHAVNLPEGGRMDVAVPSPGPEQDRAYVWGAMAGIVRSRNMFALRMKSDITYSLPQPDGGLTNDKFCVEPGTYCGLVMLFSTENAEPLAIMTDGVIQHARVASTSAVAAKYLARPGSVSLGIVGSGGMARTHAEAFASVLPIVRIRVFSPNREHREAYAEEMRAKLEIDVQAVDRPEDAVVGSDVVSGCTDSMQPVVLNDWVSEGMHLTCVLPREMEEGIAERCDVVVRHLNGGASRVWAATEEELAGRKSYDQSKGLVARTDLPTLTDLVTGGTPGRTSPDQITYYHNVPGSAVQFAATGALIYEAARAAGVGHEIPTDWFLQDIRD